MYLQKETFLPEVVIEDVYADVSVINYAVTDNSHSFDLAKEILERQAETKWENTRLIEIVGRSDMILVLVYENKLEDFLLQFCMNEDPDEANVLSRQPVIDLDEYGELVSEFELDDEPFIDDGIDNS